MIRRRLAYIGGTVIHILRLIYDVPITDIPFAVDWFIVLVGGYAGLGLIVFVRKIQFRSLIPATREPCESSWGHALIFHTVPSANTLIRWVDENASHSIVFAAAEHSLVELKANWSASGHNRHKNADMWK